MNYLTHSQVLERSLSARLQLAGYEEEDKLFFADHSGEVISDDVFMGLPTFPNVLITGHQAFFTQEAMHGIATRR